MIFVLKIVNSKFSMKDSLIGNFKMDIGSIYDEDEHQIVQKVYPYIIVKSLLVLAPPFYGFHDIGRQMSVPACNA